MNVNAGSGLAAKMAQCKDFAVFEFPFTAELETLVVKGNNGLYYTRLAVASMAAVTVLGVSNG